MVLFVCTINLSAGDFHSCNIVLIFDGAQFDLINITDIFRQVSYAL